MKKPTKYLIVIGGPTAVGKTELSIAVARHFDCDIISADSRQFYKEMSIGTAKPSAEELAQAPHHFINTLSIQDDYSVGSFEKEASKKLEEIYTNTNLAILTGGTGLYIRAITEGIDSFPAVDMRIKDELNKQLVDSGIGQLQKELEITDTQYYKKVDIENPHRLIRALSIIRGTGNTFTSYLNNKSTNRLFKPIYIALELPREQLYERINLRVDLMMQNGLLEEVTSLNPHKHLNALNTVGYSELFKYLEGEWTLAYAVDKIKQHTRNYAKRQMTWFRNQGKWKFMNPKDTEEIINYITSQMF